MKKQKQKMSFIPLARNWHVERLGRFRVCMPRHAALPLLGRDVLTAFIAFSSAFARPSAAAACIMDAMGSLSGALLTESPEEPTFSNLYRSPLSFPPPVKSFERECNPKLPIKPVICFPTPQPPHASHRQLTTIQASISSLGGSLSSSICIPSAVATPRGNHSL